MEKIKLLTRKLKTFTLDEIVILAEITEKEAITAIDKMLQEKIVIKSKQGYVFNQVKENGSQVIVAKNQTKSSELLQLAQEAKSQSYVSLKNIDKEELANIPEYNKAKMYKYLHLFEITKGLYGSRLRTFIGEYNLNNPDKKTSYSSLLKMRKTYIQQGVKGLLSGYGKGAGKSSIKDEYFEMFKKLYLSPLGLTYKKCISEVARCFGVPENQMPSLISFRRRLQREMSKADIKKERAGGKCL